MPHAVARRPSWLLPFAVVIDDLVSMSPDRPMSQAETIEIFVRLSPEPPRVPRVTGAGSEPISMEQSSDANNALNMQNQRDTDPAKLRP